MVFTRLTFGLLGAASLVAIAAFVTPRLALVTLALDALIVVLAFVDARLARRLVPESDRRVADPLRQGEPALVTRTVTNRLSRPVVVKLRDVLAPELVTEPVDRLWKLPPQSTVDDELEVVPRWRGETELAPWTVRVRGPLGLAWCTVTAGEPQRVRIYPRARFDPATSLVIRQALQRRFGTARNRVLGSSRELYALRDYLPGDDPRTIHWKQTARRRRPIVRETTWEQSQSLVLMVDCGRPMATRAGSWTKLDHALAATLALMRIIVSQRDNATLVLFSREVRRVVRVDQRTRSFAQVFEQVYREQADFEEPDYADVAAWCATRIPRRSMVIFVTSVIDLLSADLVNVAATSLARRHRPLLVNIEDETVAQLVSEEPRTVRDAFAMTSALGIEASNRELITRLRSRGIDVLTTPASRLTIGMIERYLEFKSRGYLSAHRARRVS